MKKLWTKIYCEEGVLWEKKFETEEAALLCLEGINRMKEILDDGTDEPSDYYSAAVDDTESADE